MKSKIPKENEENEEIEYKDLKFSKDFDFKEIERRLLTYIQIANRRVEQYSHERRLSLQINLTILFSISAIFASFFDALNENLKAITSVFYILYIILSFVNIVFNMSAHKTKFKPRPILERIKEFFKRAEMAQYWKTNLYYRGNIPNKVNELKDGLIKFAKNFGLKETETLQQDIKKSLIKDEIKNLYILFRYQSNYFRLARWTRILTLWGIILVGIYLFVLFVYLLN